MPVIPASMESVSKRIKVQTGLDKKQDPVSKVIRQTWLKAWLQEKIPYLESVKP
jgi:hypothetical protein